MRLLRKVRAELLSAGGLGIARGDLYRRCAVSGGAGVELRSIASTMHELDLIKVLEVRTTGRLKEMLIATEYLAQ